MLRIYRTAFWAFTTAVGSVASIHAFIPRDKLMLRM